MRAFDLRRHHNFVSLHCGPLSVGLYWRWLRPAWDVVSGGVYFRCGPLAGHWFTREKEERR